MSANNITNPTGDDVMETTPASSSQEDLGSLGVKTSDSMEPRTSSSSSSAVQSTHVHKPSTGVQTRSAGHKLPKYEIAGTDVTSFKRLHKVIYAHITKWSNAPDSVCKINTLLLRMALSK